MTAIVLVGRTTSKSVLFIITLKATYTHTQTNPHTFVQYLMDPILKACDNSSGLFHSSATTRLSTAAEHAP